MYLARTTTEHPTHFYIRETYQDGNLLKSRNVFDLGIDPSRYIVYPGGIIGPDLTGSNRGDLDYLLLNIFDPSGDIPDAYKMVMVTTKNGQVLAGNVTEEDDQKLVLSMVGQKSVIAKSDIKSRETSPVSMMPEGQMQILKDQEVINLIKYFKTQQQVELPK